MRRLLPAELRRTERRLRLISILRWSKTAGMSPVGTHIVHSIAYLADALSPVWHLPVLDAQILKNARSPFFPTLQHDLDELVGMGLVRVVRFSYVASDDGRGHSTWRIDADYELLDDRVMSILEQVELFDDQRRRDVFVREVVYAATGLGPTGISDIGLLDAAYSDPYLDVGEVLDVDPGEGELNRTAQIAERFTTLTPDTHRLSEAELIHLYIRHLYTRMNVA